MWNATGSFEPGDTSSSFEDIVALHGAKSSTGEGSKIQTQSRIVAVQKASGLPPQLEEFDFAKESPQPLDKCDKELPDEEGKKKDVTNELENQQDVEQEIQAPAEFTVAETSENAEETEDLGDTHSSDSDSSETSVPPALPALLRRASIPPHNRLKTRLQDPPPLTLAVQNQLTHCSNSLLRRRGSIQAHQADIAATNKGPFTDNVVEASTVQPPLMSAPVVAKPSVAVPVAEDDCDPLDDENIPARKKRKYEESKWILFMQWLSLVLLIAFLVCSLEIEILWKATFLSLHLWRWEALTLVIICGRLISGWIVKLLVMLIEKHYMLKRRVLYFVYGLRRSVKNCVWLALVLGVWETIFQGLEENQAVNVLTKILWCLFTASISWMVKVLAVKVAASSFHRKAYFERIQECLFNQYLLEKLSGPLVIAGIADEREKNGGCKKLLTRAEKQKSKHQVTEQQVGQKFDVSSPKATQEGLKRSHRLSKQVMLEIPEQTTVEVGEVPAAACVETRGRGVGSVVPGPLIARSPIPIEQERLQELTSDTVSVWTLKRLMKLIRKTNISTYSSIISQESDEREISSEVQAKVAAKQIFYNMARPGQKSLTMMDFLYFLSEEQAARAFSLFETTESGEITKRALTKWVVGVYKERRALALTLNDNRTVVAKLHNVVNFAFQRESVLSKFFTFFESNFKLLPKSRSR